MDTDGLRLFVLAAEKLNISAAGRELGLAPAVASAKLAKLETVLSADLLHRSTRKVSLSLEGSEFLPFAREMLAQEDAGRAALGLRQPQATGTLRFTAPSSFAQLYIAPHLPEFLAAHPGVSLDLRLSDKPFDLIEGSFDLALRNSALEDTSLKGRKLADDRRILCAAPAYLAQHGTPQLPDDLKAHQLVAFGTRAPRALVGPQGQEGTFDPRAAACRLIVDDGSSQKQATLAGAGISVNSLWSVHEEIAQGTLLRVLPDYEVADRSVLWLVYPKANVLSAKVRVFMDFLLDRIGKAPVWEPRE
ncbi:LysR substrate-binding domain-containing protein [Ruegeria sp. 2012CJ41-6]|uniref:LysR substrate-binding domain-containing protein n=1 Tax=Ruegeria spongiae TaxID=2942209 RepID=A0ABT0Q490_9RHOB|nr:LysR family transcriptional regulator [Ruegeria spongiae]MCL6284630.1 LysR substrate-binding domain-containing protein [Ruegeria spongiae]